MKTQAQGAFPFAERADESQKNAIVIEKEFVEQGDFESLSWTLLARSKDEKMLHLCGLYSDGQGKFVSTDGHRMHIAEIPRLTDRIPGGIWIYVHGDKKKISIKEAPDGILPFPAYDLVSDLPENYTKRGCIIGMGDESSIVWQYWDLTGIQCNIEYLIDICKDIDMLDVYSNDEASGAVFFYSEGSEGNTKKALLMPLLKK